MAFGRSREYNAGNAVGRTFDDGQGARLLRPENRCEFVDVGKNEAMGKLRDALIFAGIMQAAPEGSAVDRLVIENTEGDGEPEGDNNEPQGEELDKAREQAAAAKAKGVAANAQAAEKEGQ